MTDREPRNRREDGRNERPAPRGGRNERSEGRSERGGRRDERSDERASRRGDGGSPRGERSERPRGDRPERPRRESDSRSGDRPRQERPGRGGDGRERPERPAWETRVERVRGDDRPKSPMIPEEITEKDLDLLVRVQFKTLSPENAERVARHLAMVNLLINDDPELAHKHALAAADRAGRIGVVRETLGITAYTVGDFALALRELQAYRRITGRDDELPLMVDSERGMGRPDKALELGRSVPREKLEPGVRANLAIAMSGARLDRNENELALAELEIPELNPAKVFDYSPQLFRAYAHTLEILNRDTDAKRWHDLADRAERALAEKAAPKEEILEVIEEIVIPEPYVARVRPERSERTDRGDRGERGSRDRDGRSDRGERGSRDRDGRSDRGERGSRENRDSRGPRTDRGGRSDRPERGSRPSGERPGRPARARDERSEQRGDGRSERPAWKKPKSE